MLQLIFQFVGCTQQSAQMAQLNHIDSLLMKNDFVAASQQLQGIDPGVLNEPELALYSLLVTQADYKRYAPIKSDSIINRAVNYYKYSGDKEKATRSLLYQGCVYEVMGYPEKVVDCYNQADKLADEKDIANKAYAKLRMGALYHENLVGAEELAVEKYFEALRLYQQLEDKHYEMLCLTTIGSLYRDEKDQVKQDSALFFINQAIALAREQKDNYFLFENLFHKAEYYELMRHDYQTAKDLAVLAIRSGGAEIEHPRAHFCAAKSFLQLGRIDSAHYYIDHAPKLMTARDSIMYYKLLEGIAQYNNNNEMRLLNYNQAIVMADSLLIHNLTSRLYTIEKKFDLQQEELKNVTLQNRLKSAWLTVALALLAAITLLHFLWRYRNRLRVKENEYELLKSDLDSSLSSLEQMHATINDYKEELREAEDAYKADLARQEALVTNLDREIAGARTVIESQEQEHRQLNDQIAALEAKKAQSDEIRAVLDGQIQVVQELIRCSHELDNERFAQRFASLMSVPDDPRTATYWSNLHVLTNDLYNNILDDAMQLSGGRLLKSDLNFIALLCCGCSRTAIMIIMKFSNLVSISNKKNKIARKMGVASLDAFIVPYRERPRKSFA